MLVALLALFLRGIAVAAVLFCCGLFGAVVLYRICVFVFALFAGMKGINSM